MTKRQETGSGGPTVCRWEPGERPSGLSQHLQRGERLHGDVALLSHEQVQDQRPSPWKRTRSCHHYAQILGDGHLEHCNLPRGECFPATPKPCRHLLWRRGLSSHPPARLLLGSLRQWVGQEGHMPVPQQCRDGEGWQGDPSPQLTWTGFKESFPAQVGGATGTLRETEAEAQ